MHRTKKITVVTTGLALLMAATGMSSAMADPEGKTTICHSTGSQKHPYHKITVSQNAADAHMTHHAGRDQLPDSNGNCPTAPPDDEDHEVTVCHFTGENPPFQRFHFEEGDDSWAVHLGHNQDEIVEDDDDNHLCPTTPPDDEDEDDEDCNAESTSGDSTASPARPYQRRERKHRPRQPAGELLLPVEPAQRT